MQITEETVERALEAFRLRYVVTPTRPWDLNHHAGLWAEARASVESAGNNKGFVKTLKYLRSYWQLARGKNAKMMKSEDVLPLLRAKAGKARTRRLSDVTEIDASWLYELIGDVADIKRVNGEPSLMAISKVLHFFNPRLFVIVDRAMVWDWTFAHGWLWEPIASVRGRTDLATKCDPSARDDAACDIASYVAVLVWCGELIRDNRHVTKQFAAFLRRHTTTEAQLPADLETYEAAAVEWLLLGLVELPPAGVTLAPAVWPAAGRMCGR